MVAPKQVPQIEIHDETARIVKGWGTVDIFDKAGERLPIEEFKRIMPVIMDRGGVITDRHSNRVVGKILNYVFKMKDTPEGPKEGVYLTTKCYDNFKTDTEVWNAIKKGDYEGFSFGGRNHLEESSFKDGNLKKILKGLEGFEFSYVPKGCNQESTFDEINYLAKEDKSIEEEGETSNDAGHYHLYKMDEKGMGKTLGTLPREADDHTHEIVQGVVQAINNHDHKLIRMLVERTEKTYNDENKKTEEKDNSVDKTYTPNDSTLLNSSKNTQTFIKNNGLNKTMVEKDVNKNEDTNSQENSMSLLINKMDKVIDLLSVKKIEEDEVPEKDKDEKKPEVVEKVEDEKDEDKPKDEVEKEGDGEKVKLEEDAGAKAEAAKPAEGGQGDKPGANFLQKEDFDKAKEEMKKEILKEMNFNMKASTPRSQMPTNCVNKEDDSLKLPKTMSEAHIMSRELN